MNNPYGGKLIQKNAPADVRWDFELEVDLETAKDALNIATGLFSPIEGFMNQDDYHSVIDKGTLANGTIWTIPILFFVNNVVAEKISLGTSIRIYNELPVNPDIIVNTKGNTIEESTQIIISELVRLNALKIIKE